MATDDQIIIKKIKKGGHGHHGGAWKVAYADFVTAMMAFFLMLWLLSTTSPEQKMGLADYFTPTTGLKDAQGIGTKGGLSPTPEGKKRSELTDPGIVVGRLPQGPEAADPTRKINEKIDSNTGQEEKDVKKKEEEKGEIEPDKEKKIDDNAEKKKEPNEVDAVSDEDSDAFNEAEESLMNAFEQTPELQQYQDNVLIAHTPEGLKIDMVDSNNKPMFAPGSSLMTDAGKEVLEAISNIVSTTTNKIAISGHTDSNYFGRDANYTSWELSSDRANAARRRLAETGMETERFAKIQGLADTDLLVPSEPNSPRNRRISLILMRGKHIQSDEFTATSRGLLSIPNLPKDTRKGTRGDSGQQKKVAPAQAPAPTTSDKQ